MSEPSDPLSVEVAKLELVLADILTDMADMIVEAPTLAEKHLALETFLRDKAMSHYKDAYNDLREYERNKRSYPRSIHDGLQGLG